MSQGLINAIINIVYPLRCLGCAGLFTDGDNNQLLCKSCYEKIESNLPPFCKKCGLGKSNYEPDDCLACKGKFFNFDRAWSACIYKEPVKNLIHIFKYNSKLRLRRLFLTLFSQFIKEYCVPIADYDFVLAVPMHPARLREKEFNHAHILAQDLGVQFTIPVFNNLVRSRNNLPQTGLSLTERINNVKDVFKIKNPEQAFNKNILIIDDVFTTGSTVSEIASVLKRNGAGRVDVLTLARVYQENSYENN
jgi:ComF family protein